MFGRNPRCELDLMFPLPVDLHKSPRDAAEGLFHKQQEAFQAARLKEDVTIRRQRMAYKGPIKRFHEGQFVWLFVPRPPKTFVKLSIWWTGPWVVTKVLNTLTYQISWTKDPSRVETVTVDRLRPYFHDIVVPPPRSLMSSDDDQFIEQCTLPKSQSLGIPFTDPTLHPFEYNDSDSDEILPQVQRDENELQDDESDSSDGGDDDSPSEDEPSSEHDDETSTDNLSSSDNDSDDSDPPPPNNSNRFQRVRSRIGNLPAYLTPDPNSERSRRMLTRSQRH